jgi:glycosyltransferase involved in cell wall biosynthesis
VSPPARHPLLWKYWYDVKVAMLLRKLKADVFFSPDGQCSLTTGVPQCVVIHDLGFLHHPEGYKKSHWLYLRKYTPKFIKKAIRIVTVSHFSKSDIISRYKTNKEKIDIVYNGVKQIFQPSGLDQGNFIKEKYANGSEYFLYVGAIHPRKNLVNVLKAFSIFKRRLKSSMKLVLAGRLAWKNEEFLHAMNTYKYKEDVVLTGYLEENEIVRLMGAAYALVYPSLCEGFGVPVIEAMACGVPVLTSKNSSMQEIGEDAAIYFDPYNIDDIADKLMRIYKDENERKELIKKGFIVAKKYTWQRTADAVWEALVKTASSK